MPSTPQSVRAMGDLAPGDHLWCLYQAEAEHRVSVTSFLRQGLERGEKVLSIVDAHVAEAHLGHLRDDGLDVEPCLTRGQLRLLTVDQAHLRGGSFEPDRMIRLLREEMERALAEGYPALRVAEEMGWVLRGLPGSDRLIEYENKLNEFLPGSRCLVVCQYDRRRFDPAVLLDALHVHPTVLIGTEVYDNCYYLPPAVFLSGQPVDRLQLWTELLADRKRMDVALRQAEAKYRAMFEHAVEGIFQGTPGGRAQAVNPALARMLGYGSPEALLSAVSDIGRQVYADPERRAEFRRLLDEHGEVRGFEAELLRQDGSRIWGSVSARAVRDAQGTVGYYEGTIEDITDRKRTEEALRKFAHVVEQTADAVVITDRDGIIQYVNPAFEALTGYAREDALGKTPRILKSGQHDQGFYQRLWKTICSGGVFRAVFTNRKKGGGLIYAEETITPITDPGGTITHFVSVCRDITARIQAEEQLRRSREQLRALAGHLESVREEERARIAREAHDELGQALTALKFDLAWLIHRLPKHQPAAQEKAQGMLALIDTTINTVRRISEDLRPSILDTLGLVAALEWQAQEFQTRTGIACSLLSGLPDVTLDRTPSTALFRICQESLTNVARHAQATRVIIRLSAEADYLALAVEDNGRGIPEQDFANATSLGLLGMRERALLLGGELTIVGRPGAGTTVMVKVPLRSA
ncbi:MAG TPA: PAS domain S-box protein [Candidatus Methylomirabilis sp.]|nr:PAS domain S-box protein [Candidatus Methylomirabilis sp.]